MTEAADEHTMQTPPDASGLSNAHLAVEETLREKIALAFIHRNEGQLAIEMLASVLPIVGFVAFVDTSSDDGSREVIEHCLLSSGKPYLLKVIPRSSFDEMRNESLDLVPEKFEWILVMDSDEVLLSKDYPKIAELIGSTTVDAWSIPRFNWVDRIWGSLNAAYPDLQTRLFKNRPAGRVRYVNKVHELPAGFSNRMASSEPKVASMYNDEFHIHHVKLFKKTGQQIEVANRLYADLQREHILRNATLESMEIEEIDFSNPRPTSFDTSVIRVLHSVDLTSFGAPRARAFWAEWNHPLEGSRHLEQIIVGPSVANWSRFIKPGSSCIDIGAHSGDTAIPMAVFAQDVPRGLIGNVFVAEPNPDVFKVLTINLALNSHLAKFKAFGCAVTRVDQPEVLMADHGNANCNGGILDVDVGLKLEEQMKTTSRVTFKVRGLSLATFVRQNLSSYEQKNLSFIKMDCEGYDKEILWGAKEILSSMKPVIMIEWFDLFGEEQSLDLFAAIEHIGYQAYEAHSLQPASVHQKAGDLILVARARLNEFF